MRLIDADKAKQELSMQLYVKNGLSAAERAIEIMDAQPTVDAILVVRCKDCKYSESTTDLHGEQYPFLICTACESMAVGHNDYCSEGKKE